MCQADTVFPAKLCRAIELPETLAARAGVVEVLAVEDEDLGGYNYHSRWERVPGGYRVIGERLRLFSIPEQETLEGLVLAARGREATDTAAMIRDADHRHASAGTMRDWLRTQRQRGNPGRARRH